MSLKHDLTMVDGQHESHEVHDHGVQMETDESLHEHHSELQALRMFCVVEGYWIHW